MPTDHKISVIVPVYNVRPYIEQCLHSIQQQTHTNLEIIPINDGSTDGSGAICDMFASHDSRFTVIHQENKGVSAARNAGLDIATGLYIGFVGPDDYIGLDFYEALLSTLIEYDACVSVGREILASSNGEPLIFAAFFHAKDKILYDNNLSVIEGITDGEIGCDSGDKLYKRELWENVRYPEDLTIGEDIATVIGICANAKRAVYEPSASYFYRQREGSALRGTVTKERFLENRRATEIMRQIIIDKNPEKATGASWLKILHDIACINSYLDTCKAKGVKRKGSLLHLMFCDTKSAGGGFRP